MHFIEDIAEYCDDLTNLIKAAPYINDNIYKKLLIQKYDADTVAEITVPFRLWFNSGENKLMSEIDEYTGYDILLSKLTVALCNRYHAAIYYIIIKHMCINSLCINNFDDQSDNYLVDYLRNYSSKKLLIKLVYYTSCDTLTEVFISCMYRGYYDVAMRLLLNPNINLSTDNNAALTIAIQNDLFDMVRELLQKYEVRFKNYCLTSGKAIVESSDEMLKFLLSLHYFDPTLHNNYLLTAAVIYNQPKSLKILIESPLVDINSYGCDSLITAIKYNKRDMVNIIISNNRIDISMYNFRPITKAIKYMRFDILSDLVEYSSYCTSYFQNIINIIGYINYTNRDDRILVLDILLKYVNIFNLMTQVPSLYNNNSNNNNNNRHIIKMLFEYCVYVGIDPCQYIAFRYDTIYMYIYTIVLILKMLFLLD